MSQVLKYIPRVEFDYQTLQDALADYARPRDKISDLLRKKEIVRIKKGLYILGDEHRKRPYSRELLANLIYGPSYISLEYALAYHGLIPERVEMLTSTTSGRSKSFDTPVGKFTYWSVPVKYYRVGVDLIEAGDGLSFLMATPEKALADKVLRDWGSNIRKAGEMDAYLLEDLRIDEEDLKKLKVNRIDEISHYTRSRKVALLLTSVRKIKGAGK